MPEWQMQLLLVAMLMFTPACSAHLGVEEIRMVKSNLTMRRQTEYVLHGFGENSTLPPVNKVTLTMINFFFLGNCGIDRCYVGQYGLGVGKCLFGLFFSCLGCCCFCPFIPNTWAIIDDAYLILNAIHKSSNITELGWDVTFDNDAVQDDHAYGWGIAGAILHIQFYTITLVCGFMWALSDLESMEDVVAEGMAAGRQRNSLFVSQVPAQFEIDRVFGKVDANGDEQIDEGELKTCLRMLGMESNDELLKEVMAEGDLDKTGTLNKEEFALLISKNAVLSAAVGNYGAGRTSLVPSVRNSLVRSVRNSLVQQSSQNSPAEPALLSPLGL